MFFFVILNIDYCMLVVWVVFVVNFFSVNVESGNFVDCVLVVNYVLEVKSRWYWKCSIDVFDGVYRVFYKFKNIMFFEKEGWC